MTSRAAAFATRSFIVFSILAFGLFGYGCGGNNDHATLSGSFVASGTATAVDLVKLVPQSSSGARIVVQAVIYGPDVALDMYTFAFDVKIGNTNVLAYVPNSATAGNALTASAGQTITAIAGPDASDASHIVVGVGKLGGGPGNGVAGASAVIVTLAFDVLREGTSTLAIAATPAPSVVDHNGAAIGSITFDAANGTVTGISTGGGPY